jgi:hypothetical protein
VCSDTSPDHMTNRRFAVVWYSIPEHVGIWPLLFDSRFPRTESGDAVQINVIDQETDLSASVNSATRPAARGRLLEGGQFTVH